MPITIHPQSAYPKMRAAGKLGAEVLDFITPYVEVGVTTEKLNQLCHDFIIENGAIPAPLNYRGFPKSICTSVNHVICHGIPGEKKLKNGDIVNIDVTVIVDGWYGDTSRMFLVGDVNIKAKKLVDTTYQAMMLGIEQVKPGATLGDIGYAIQNFAEDKGYSVVKDYCGHGIGQVFHDDPNVMHFGEKGTGMALEEGMFFTIEPMINIGSWETYTLQDGWTAITKDRSLSAQFEHTIGITEDGNEIFTLSENNTDFPINDL